MNPRLYAFVDGAYLLERSRELGVRWPDPLHLVERATSTPTAQRGAGGAIVKRVNFYDALPAAQDSGSEDAQERARYRQAVELLSDTHLGYGMLKRDRDGKKARQQKGVDTLLVVDMLVGAFTNLFDVAMLVAGDADFVPVVEEVRRRGVNVILVAAETSRSDELARAADRRIALTSREKAHTIHNQIVSAWPQAMKGFEQPKPQEG